MCSYLVNIQGRQVLTIWTVYDHPLDFPDYFVARRFETDRPTNDYIADKSLEIIRNWLAYKGLSVLPRSDDDEYHIIECWL